MILITIQSFPHCQNLDSSDEKDLMDKKNKGFAIRRSSCAFALNFVVPCDAATRSDRLHVSYLMTACMLHVKGKISGQKLRHLTFDFGYTELRLGSSVLDFRSPTSDLRPLISDLRPLISDL